MKHTRLILCVGKGGMAVERIGDFRIMYDCGSSKQHNVQTAIDLLAMGDCNKIDMLILSHYDNDHVNGIEYLLGKMQVVKCIIPFVPNDLRIVYDSVCDDAYTRTVSLLRGNNCQLIELGNQEKYSENINHNELWQWNVHTMIKEKDWRDIRRLLYSYGFDLNRGNDATYISSQTKIINSAFKDLGYKGGSNGKGLIMLSQRMNNARINNQFLNFDNTKLNCHNVTGCLYVGDADLDKKTNENEVSNFVNKNVVDDKLLLMQIPHHGSKNNINNNFLNTFDSYYYFVCDSNTKRINANPTVGPILNDILFVTTSKGRIDNETIVV